MTRTLYEGMGAAGALVGVNLISIMLGLHKLFGPVVSCYIAEAVAVLTLMGIIYDMLPDNWRKNSLLILPLAVVGGFIWEALTFMSLESVEVFESMMMPWLQFGIPTILLIGFPVLLISSFMRRRHKVIVKVTGKRGVAINFFVCMVFAMLLFWLMIHFHFYDFWRGFFHI